jgi:hypothetical protein
MSTKNQPPHEHPTHLTTHPRAGLYASPEDALKKVDSEFEYWTGRLTDTSLQMCYALIGANWVIFGSVDGILKNNWAKTSLVLVLLALASSVIGSWVLSESLCKRIAYAESNVERWRNEFENSIEQDNAWPFTDSMQNMGFYMRWVKAGFTLASGFCLIVGALTK